MDVVEGYVPIGDRKIYDGTSQKNAIASSGPINALLDVEEPTYQEIAGDVLSLLETIEKSAQEKQITGNYSIDQPEAAILEEGTQAADSSIKSDAASFGIMTINPAFGLPASTRQYRCDIFMIMPFETEFEFVYSDHIMPVVHELTLDIKRGDDFFSREPIMRDIWSAIYASCLVIAECTGQNPNVFYELGIAHVLGKPAIMITQNITDIPFDLMHLRAICYDPSDRGMGIFKKKLRRAILYLLDDIEQSQRTKIVTPDFSGTM